MQLTSVEPLIAADENVSCVPGWTAPVFVMVNGWFAIIFVLAVHQKKRDSSYAPWIPRSQPEMNALATASTSLGSRAISNA